MFMIFSFCFSGLDIMWTAFVKSYSYAFRWSFVFAFVMIMLAASAVSEIQKHKINKSALFKAIGLILIIFLILDFNGKFNNRFVSYIYMAAIICYALAILITASSKNSKIKRCACLILVSLVTFAELRANAAVVFSDYKDLDKILEDYDAQMSAVINEIKSNDNTFYRLEKQVSYLSALKSNVASS